MIPDIPSYIFDEYNYTVNHFWSKPITFFYPEITEECSNCYYNGSKSTGVYKTGGPYPFDNGSICPLCAGEGVKVTEPTSSTSARIYYSRKDWITFGPKVEIPDAAAQIVFNMDDLPSVQNCKYIIPAYYTGINAFQNQRLFRVGNFFPQGFTQNPIKYVITFWATNG